MPFTLKRHLALLGALRRGTARDGLPYKLTLILNGNCPTRCSFCSIWKTPSPDELTAEEWDKVFASVPHTVWANLSGGEIFMRPDLPEIVAALTSRLPDLALVDFPTTGYYPDRVIETCEQLHRAGVAKIAVTVSLDGPPELHDRLRGREGAHAKAYEAMAALRRAKLPRVSAFFGMTLLPENCESIDETIAGAAAAVPGLGATDFHFNLGMESTHYYRNAGAQTAPPKTIRAQIERLKRGGFDPISILERAYQKRIPRYLKTGRSPVPCAALRASVFVDAQGVVYPCSIYDRPLGHLREADYSMAAILRSRESYEARRVVIEDDCPGCWTPCEAYQSLFAWFFRSSRHERGLPPLPNETDSVEARLFPPVR